MGRTGYEILTMDPYERNVIKIRQNTT